MHETLWEMHRTQNQFIAQMNLLTERIVELQYTLKQQPFSQQKPSQHQMSSVDSLEFGHSTLAPTSSVLHSLECSVPGRNTIASTDVIDVNMPSSSVQWVHSDSKYVRL